MNKQVSDIEITENPSVPPALSLILQQFSEQRDWSEVRKRIRSALRDIKEQSQVFEEQNLTSLTQSDSSTFDIHLHGALDLLSGRGCTSPSCRIAAAERVARSFGIIADRIWITDHLTDQILNLGRATNAEIDKLMGHAIALEPLIPLMKAGIVRFRTPWLPSCASCASKFELAVESATEELIEHFSTEIKVEEYFNNGYIVRTGNYFTPPLILHSTNSKTQTLPSENDVARQIITREVRTAFWAAREATQTNGSIFSNSRVGLAGLLQFEEKTPRNQQELRIFEDNRALDVPWVSNLNSNQILELRAEASKAMPTFREMLARATTVSGEEKPTSAADLISDLRIQAEEVRAELAATQSKSARYWKTAYGVFGLGLSIYGVASDQALAGVSGLLPIIQLLIDHKTSHESEIEKLKSRPGYVLVKAQDILSHTH